MQRPSIPQSSLFRRSGGGSGVMMQSDAVPVEETERENNAILSALLGDVRAMKKGITSVRDEVVEHKSIVNSLQDVLLHAKDGLKKTMTKLDSVSGTSSGSHIGVLLVVAFIVCIFIYILLRRGR